MPTTIEQLELEVQSSATSAVSGLEALSASLEKVKAATKGGMGLANVSKRLEGLNTALSSLDTSNFDKISKVAESLEKLNGVSGLKISSTIAKQLIEIGNASASLNNTDFGGVRRLSYAVASLNGLNATASSLSSMVRQLKKLPEVVNAINSLDQHAFSAQTRELSAAFATLNTQLATLNETYSRLPASMRSVVSSTNQLSQANSAASGSYINLWAKVNLAMNAMRRGASMIASWINQANQYVEDVNLFDASMGKYAESAQTYAEKVGEVLGIDPGEFMRNQGTFQTIITGFGVAADKAYTMSKNLTQLGYDLGSFFNIPFESAMEKVQSGISGELEPLRRLGFDLSVARLQEEALALGIQKKVSAMTQAEKSQLRYYAMLTQVTTAQGDMARTLNAPANQLRVLQAQLRLCARALGQIFIPALNAVLPYIIAVVKAVRMLAEALAKLLGFEMPEVDYSGLDGAASATDDMNDSMADATKTANKLKRSIMGFDELNTLKKDTSTDTSNSNDLGIDLPTYDFLGDAVSNRVDEIIQKMKDWLGITDDIKTASDLLNTRLGKILTAIIDIGVAMGAWKIAKGVTEFFNTLSHFKGFSGSLFGAGFLNLLSDLEEFNKYFKDFVKNGPTFYNVTGMLSEFAGALGDCFMMLGNLKVAGALKTIQGVGEIVGGIADIVKNGPNWDNVTRVIRGISNVMIGIGALTGNIKLVGWGMALQGMLGVVTQVKNIIKAFKTGDWSDVSWESLVISSIQAIVGVAMGLGAFSKIKGAISKEKTVEPVKELADTTGQIGETVKSGLSPKLKSLAQNLGLGLVIIAEVAAAAALVVGAVILLGKELEQVGIAWEPVIENGQTVATAMGIGVGILAAVGAVTAGLGSVGTTLITNLGLGLVVLTEIGIAAGLFVAEIWLVGEGLNKISEAWSPVLDNGKQVATAVGLGTGVLVAVGVATAALGAATVASAGTIPIAIGIGTALLAELGIAAGLFIVEITKIGTGLSNINKAWQPVLQNSGTVAQGIKTGTTLLIAVGAASAALGVATVASAGLLPVAIALGTAMLVQLSDSTMKFTDGLTNVANQLSGRLAPALSNLNIVLPQLNINMKKFLTFMQAFAGYVWDYTKSSAISGLGATVDTIVGWFTRDPLEKLASDVEGVYEGTKNLNDKLNVAVPELKEAVTLLTKYRTFLDKMQSLTKGGKITLSNDIYVNMKDVGKKLVTGLAEGMESESGRLNTAANKVTTSLNRVMQNGTQPSTYSAMGRNVVSGLSSGMSGFATPFNNITRTMSSWASNFGRNMFTWGSDLMRNMVNGISSGLRSLQSQVASAASTIRSYLHFSQPDVGPLADFNTWMPDMMSQLAGGIAKDEDKVRKQVEHLAGTMSLEPTMQANVTAYSGTPTVRATSGDSSAELANAVYNAVSTALNEQAGTNEDNGTPIIINLGNEQIASFLVKQNRRTALISGGRA